MVCSQKQRCHKRCI